jgi:hypothetical protein
LFTLILVAMSAHTSQPILISSPLFSFKLDTSHGISAVAWTNRLTGKTLKLDSPEVELDVDTAERRIPITGWRCWRFENESLEYADPAFRDASWQGRTTPIPGRPDPGNEWARTHVFLPKSAEGKRVALTIGNYGVFDFRRTRVFVNGTEIGDRLAPKRWNDPKEFILPAKLLRFGTDNVIALCSTGEVYRTPKLDQVDPEHAQSLPGKWAYPALYEQYVTVGKPLATPALKVTSVRKTPGEAIVKLKSVQPALEATVRYWWKNGEPVLHKFITVVNKSRAPIRLLNIRLGQYATGMDVTDGDMGFPAYAGGQFFFGVEHPTAFCLGQEKSVRLFEFPGKVIQPGGELKSSDAVLGVAKKGEARQAFVRYLESRMRRVQRGHDRAYAIYEQFASWPGEDFFGCSEQTMLPQIAAVDRWQKETGGHFDIVSMEFWCDRQGDLVRADPGRFPHQFAPVTDALKKTGCSLGLWIDSSQGNWNIGENPVAQPAAEWDPAYGTIDLYCYCRGTEPIKSLFANMVTTHIRDHGVRLFKFDNMNAVCVNPAHDHLGGVYGARAAHDGVIDTLQAADRASPDAFLMLYWGMRSPWWLLWADTLFDPGLSMEAASPSSKPSLYVRDGVTVGLDQSCKWCEDIPPMGKDSLGTWFSDWEWNSCIGTERWQEAFIMDMCRGNLLAQPWAGLDVISKEERAQMATFIGLLRERANCFKHPKLILGDPWKYQPYGYFCSDGRRTFLGLNNCTWKDVELPVNAKGMDVYRWWPSPGKLTGFAGKALLRPWEVVFLELVPKGEKPSLGRLFSDQQATTTFSEPSGSVAFDVTPSDEMLPVTADHDNGAKPAKRSFVIRCHLPATRNGGILVVSAEMVRDGKAVSMWGAGRNFGAKCDSAAPQPIVRERGWGCPWQGWRIPVPPGDARDIALTVSALLDAKIELRWSAMFVPTDSVVN